MPRSRPRTFQSQFTGLELNDSSYVAGADKAIVLENMYVDQGRLELKLGRKELAEDQVDPEGALGIAAYTPPDQSFRSVVVVRPDGIYQRVG